MSEIVIIGAGSSGAVIAARATERSDREVLLLEAGPDYPARAALPRDLEDGTRNSWLDHDWHYRAVPTPSQQIRLAFPRGKVVGGSSAVNTCIALRPMPHDLDEWGLDEWRWDACLPAFKRLEDDLDFQNEHHGQGGPIPIRRHPPSELVPWQAAFVGSCRALGYPDLPDVNDPTMQGGVGPHAMNKIKGVRMSAALGYLTPQTRARPNLHIRSGALVQRVLIENRRVTGVEIEIDGRTETIKTKKVILSAGAIATPGVLLRSGVGPRDAVSRIGVELIADVPAVGARLLDHPGVVVALEPRPGVLSVNHPLIQTVLRYTSKNSEYPFDMQLQPGSFFPLFPRMPLKLVAIACCVGKPRGHGRLEFTSADAKVKPRIFSQMLADPHDRACALEAMLLGYECVRSSSMRHLARFTWPANEVMRDRDALERWMYLSCGSGYHPSGTAPIGRDGDVGAAADAHGRVRGVEGLFVADASIMPTIPTANTNLTALMIGERFGEWLRDGTI